MSRRRARKKWEDVYALRKGIFIFFVFSFAMIVFFQCLKIINEPAQRQEFHRLVSQKVDTYLRGRLYK